jgi:uncharacterized protein (TIGR03083 family)
MEISEHVTALRRDGTLLADAAERAGLTAAVPPCPAWRIRDLLRHTGHVHRWAAGIVATGSPEPPADDLSEAEVLAGGPPDEELIGWFRDGHAALVAALCAADPTMTCWTVVPGSTSLAAWARRQAHETAIHRLDAELASGADCQFPADFAADGVDELVMGFYGRARGNAAGPRRVLQVLATDADGAWLIELTTKDGKARAAAVSRGQATADCTLAGPASALYPLLWNRYDLTTAGITVTGDETVLRAWRDGMRIRWT